MRLDGRHIGFAAAFVVGAVAIRAAAPVWQPAKLQGGSIPQPATTAVGGGEVFIEASVSQKGALTGVRPLRTTPPFADMMLSALRSWDFAPALDADVPGSGRPSATPRPVPSRVLIGAIFRPPTLLGPTLGEVPKDVARPSDEVPFPLSTTMPPYPPHARASASVLLELQVDASGSVVEATVIQSAPPFDEPARTAALSWRFRPAMVNRRAVPSLVYIVFGFPAPILG